MSQKRAFGKYLQQFPENIRNIAVNLRILILKLIPRVIETVHPGMKWISYGTPKSVLAIKPEQSHVKLFFFEGVRLHDPNNLLKGSGSRLRFISVIDLAKSKNIITDLIKQAYFMHTKKKM